MLVVGWIGRLAIASFELVNDAVADGIVGVRGPGSNDLKCVKFHI